MRRPWVASRVADRVEAILKKHGRSLDPDEADSDSRVLGTAEGDGVPRPAIAETLLAEVDEAGGDPSENAERERLGQLSQVTFSLGAGAPGAGFVGTRS